MLTGDAAIGLSNNAVLLILNDTCQALPLVRVAQRNSEGLEQAWMMSPS